MRSGRWVLLGTFAFALGNNGVYFLLGKILPSELVGTYFFAFQLVTSLGILLANSSYQVLLAAFSRVGNDIVRLRVAVARALDALVLIVSMVSLAVAVVFRPLEQVLWHGKWASAAGAVEILAVIWPAAAFVSVLHAVQAASGRFRLWGSIAFITSVASILGCVLGALLGRSAGAAATGYGAGTLAGLLINVRYSLTPLGMRPVPAMLSALRPWLATVAAAAASVAVGRLVGDALLDVLVSVSCFGVTAVIGLRLIANDSLQLVLDSMRRMIAARAIARQPLPTGS
jgi:O-antigen/teichoic acid export membrane protein